MMIAGTPLRSSVVGLALLVATFVGGLLAGVAVERTLGAQDRGEPSVQSERPSRMPMTRPSRPARPASFLERIELTPEQEERVGEILERGQEETRAFWEEEGGRLRGIVDSTRARIREVLTPEQQAEYDALRAEHRRRGRQGVPPSGRRVP